MKRLLLFLSVFILISCQHEAITEDSLPITPKDDITQAKIQEKSYEVIKSTWLKDHNYELIEEIIINKFTASIVKYNDEHKLIIFSNVDKKVVFETDLQFDDFYLDEEKSHHLSIHNDTLLIISCDGIASSPGLILMYNLENYQLVFNHLGDYLSWIDVDTDGIEEIYVLVQYGGQVSYDIGFSYVFSYTNEGYKPDYNLTFLQKQKELSDNQIILDQSLTLENLSTVLEITAYLSDQKGCEQLLEKYEVFLKANANLLDTKNDEAFKYRFYNWSAMVTEYKNRWGFLQYAETIQSIFANEKQSWYTFTDFELGDLDKDGVLEGLISFEGEYSDYGKSFLMDNNTYQLVVQNGSYHAEDVTILPYNDDLLIYVQMSNSVYPLGSKLFRYNDGKLNMIFNQSSPSGNGYSYPYDANGDGNYEGISFSINDYVVYYHPIEWIYIYKNDEIIEEEVHYYLSEISSDTKTFLFQYLDALWLTQTYGSNESITERLAHMDNNLIDRNKLTTFINTLHTQNTLYEEDILQFTLIDSDDSKLIYEIQQRFEPTTQPIKISLSTNIPSKILSIE